MGRSDVTGWSLVAIPHQAHRTARVLAVGCDGLAAGLRRGRDTMSARDRVESVLLMVREFLIRRYVWISSGTTTYLRSSRSARRLAQAGIVPAGAVVRVG
jgi:hypothetical protein